MGLFGAAAVVITTSPGPAGAVEAGGLVPGAVGSKVWISGKSEKPKGSEDKTGTKRDVKFLRCLSNCIPDCQKLRANGEALDRETCLERCQDDCCETYEQCTCTLNPGAV